MHFHLAMTSSMDGFARKTRKGTAMLHGLSQKGTFGSARCGAERARTNTALASEDMLDESFRMEIG